MSKESLAQFFQSKLFAGIIVGVCIMLVVICIFEAGVVVGYHEASFSSHWGENYGANFSDTNPSNQMGLPDMHEPTPDGILGKIISVDSASTSSTTIVISSTQKPEEKILIDANTEIRSRESTLTISSLKIGTYVVVLGTPNDQGEVQANLIRIVPAPSPSTP
jgi:hypothetical protein